MNATDDWYDVEAISGRAHRLVEGPYYGCYCIGGTERSVVVDAGIGVGDLRGLVAGLVDTPVTLVLTHWHWDHIGNAAQFDDVRVHPMECDSNGRVALDGRSTEFVDRPARFVRRWQEAGNRFPDAFDPEAYTIDPLEEPTTVVGGESLDLGDRHLELLHTPGHSPGHLAVLDRSVGALYGGDVLHKDRGLYVHLQGGDVADYLETFARLVDLRDDGAFDTLWTSHNPPLAGDDLHLLDRLEEGLREIVDGTATPRQIETDWGPANRYDVHGSTVLTDVDAG